MHKRNKNSYLFIHSGGVTPVVNAVAHKIHELIAGRSDKLYVSPHGINGLLQGSLIDAQDIPAKEWSQIQFTPGSSFGSSRVRLPSDSKALESLFLTLDQHNINTLFCNGGNNSQLITLKLQQAADALGYPLQCIGIPKTIDNDIYHTDTCPGFGSAAKYTATSVFEMSLDLAAMCQSSTQVLIYEAMGRDTGWLAAASALARPYAHTSPHIILVPEAQFSIKAILEKTKTTVAEQGFCVIVIAEGAVDQDKVLSSHPHHRYRSLHLDAILQQALNLKTHVVIPDYLQRSAHHIASKTDVEQAAALAKHALKLATDGLNGIMVNIKRLSSSPYQWTTEHIDLTQIAGRTRLLPNHFIDKSQLDITESCIKYITPLIQGEVTLPYKNGIPNYSHLIYPKTTIQEDPS